MTTAQDDFYSNISGALTPEQAIQALALEASGDTGAHPDHGGAPTTTTAPDKITSEGATSPVEDNYTAENAVILAKDGKHTIPFDRLEKARQQRDAKTAEADTYRTRAEQAEQRAEEALRNLAVLQEKAQIREANGQAPTATDNMAAHAQAAIEAGADVSLFGDFSEEALAAGIKKMVAQNVASQVREQVEKALAPLKAKEQTEAASSHYETIYKAHPNADSIVQSAEFKSWVDSQPSVVRSAYWDLFDSKTGGTAGQIVEVFDAYKAATEKPSSNNSASSETAVQAALRAARAEPPSSLSSIPGGRAQGSTPLDSTGEMSGPEMLAATRHLSPQQIDAWLSKQI